MSRKQRSSERIFLFTLVDLLLQMLFVFLAVLLISDKKVKEARAKNGDVQKLEQQLSQATGDLKRLREENSSKQTENDELQKQLGAALGLPPCLCKDGECSKSNKSPKYIVDFEITDGGIQIYATIPETNQKDALASLSGKSYSVGEFTSAFKKFRDSKCIHYVYFVDGTSGENKEGFKLAVKALNRVFYAFEKVRKPALAE